MDILKSAIYKTGYHSEIRAKALCEAIKIKYPMFTNKICMTNDEHQLSIFQAVDIQLATNTRHIHQAMGVLLDEQSIPSSAAEPVDLMSAVLRVGASHGNINNVIDASLENDRKIDMQELMMCISTVAGGIKDLQVLHQSLVKAAENGAVIKG